MVEQGWAAAYRRYSEDYVSSEEAAERSAQGIWVGPFVMPWDWRRGERVGDRREAKPRADGGAIKGNINSEGIKIYHVPGGSKICLLPTLVTLQPERVRPIAAKPRS